uniref:Uncharacterized protein n=1 Tax=Rhizophora mucronata TaxID=61149 RepID=A0A2P2LY38_RHIMU
MWRLHSRSTGILRSRSRQRIATATAIHRHPS